MKATTASAHTNVMAGLSACSDVYEKPKPKWNWRSYLTAEELAVLAAADKAKAAWLKLNKERAGITNRAIQRAKYAALSRS
jgi:hypothetical protein